jgi:23S rRNA pseudouridine2605 synthase
MDKEKVRLQKFLAAQGIASRREAEQMIADGRVAVNGVVVTAQGVKIDPEQDQVQVDRQYISGSQPRMRYVLLNKPPGYICSVHDERKRRTVMDLLTDIDQRIYPVGRLDYHTAGLLLLTNDGALTHKLLHPSHQIVKTYIAEVSGIPSAAAMTKLEQGIPLSDGITAPATARILRRLDNNARLEIKIHEGRNRQVRRMMDAVGYPVQRLQRSGLAFLTLEGLRLGEYRNLTAKEIQALKEL